MVPVGDVPNLSTLADIMCCRIGALPMTYLSFTREVVMVFWSGGAEFMALGDWLEVWDSCLRVDY